jgi:hypothetical protein
VLCLLHGLGLDSSIDALSCVSGGGYVGSSYTLARAGADTGTVTGTPATGWAQEYFQNFYDHGGYLCNFAPRRGPDGEPEAGRPGEGKSRLLCGLRDIVFFFSFFGVATAMSMVIFLAPAIIWVRLAACVIGSVYFFSCIPNCNYYATLDLEFQTFSSAEQLEHDAATCSCTRSVTFMKCV